ncbi:MAG: THUMP domain-containing protein [Saprospiraceae bacterium]|nr:THUMP domain-containing protein [Saprospiraceae bacterium]
MKIIVRTLQGLEAVLADELQQLGCSEIQILTRAVACEADTKQLYAANCLLRTAIKVMVPLKEVVVRNEQQLYAAVKDIAWEEIFSIHQSFSVEGVVHSDIFRHSQYAALKSKDAIADRFRELTGKRPFVNPVSADIAIVIHIRQNILTILLDASGSSLHQRGYRVYPVEAPLNEVLAAGMVLLSGWDRQTTLVDPMCGSGTLLIEAAYLAGNIPPQSPDRKYCFQNWKTFDGSIWKQVQNEAKENIKLSQIPELIGFDKSIRCVNATKTNVEEAGLAGKINVERADFFQNKGHEGVFVITNPPYDERLKEDDIHLFYRQIGDTLKKNYQNTTTWIIGGNLGALKQIGLKPGKKISLLNGDIESGFYKFELYEGSRKNKSVDDADE